MNIKFNKDGPVTFGALGGTYPQMNAKAGDFAVVSGIVRNGVLGPAVGDIVRPDNAASVTITMDGVKYTADSGVLGDPFHLVGPVVNEYHKAVPLTKHLTARWVIRQYVGVKAPRVDLTIENNWAYEPGPQNFTYDVEVSIGGTVVYSKAALKHYHHARWRKVFNDYGVVADYPWNGTPAVPPFDPAAIPQERVLATLGRVVNEPMGIGAAMAYMPTTGAHDDIGLLPAWQSSYLLSMDKRARDAMIATADGSGSWSMHYRDKNTDLPVSLFDFPCMTLVGNEGDAYNYEKRRSEAFPRAGGDVSTPYTNDTAHQPSLAYLPYLVTGDYYYLEELQFWAMYNTFMSNPNYRGKGQGLIIWDQLRGQGWSMRTIGQAAYITPDSDPLKAQFNTFLNNNLDFYNTTYALNPAANKIGVMTHGYSMHDDVHVAPWMDDFFTSAMGYLIDLGFEKARPIFEWKTRFTVGRLLDPGFCWLNGSAYDIQVRDSVAGAIYGTMAECYIKTFGAAAAAAPCPLVGNMGNGAENYNGWTSNMQPAVAYAARHKVPRGAAAWKQFEARTVKADNTLGAEFAIIPHASTTLPIEGTDMTYTVSIELTTSTVQLPPGSEAAPTSTLVEILDADQATVLAGSATAPYVLPKITAGLRYARATDYDSKGVAMGKPVIVPFTITEEVTPPANVTATLTSGMSITYKKD